MYLAKVLSVWDRDEQNRKPVSLYQHLSKGSGYSRAGQTLLVPCPSFPGDEEELWAVTDVLLGKQS